MTLIRGGCCGLAILKDSRVALFAPAQIPELAAAIRQ
jgi:hypothetical protein